MSDTENARNQARAQYDSIAEMVAAAEMDWDRLEGLREERDTLKSDLSDAEVAVIGADEDEIEEARETLEDQRAYFDAWNAEHGAELQELEETAGDYEDADAARQAIQEDALSVETRSGWTSPGEEMEAEEFRILLCTGGPAVRIRGTLGNYNEPDRAWLEYQDWFTPWTEYHGEEIDQAVLLTYCREFLGG